MWGGHWPSSWQAATHRESRPGSRGLAKGRGQLASRTRMLRGAVAWTRVPIRVHRARLRMGAPPHAPGEALTALPGRSRSRLGLLSELPTAPASGGGAVTERSPRPDSSGRAPTRGTRRRPMPRAPATSRGQPRRGQSSQRRHPDVVQRREAARSATIGASVRADTLNTPRRHVRSADEARHRSCRVEPRSRERELRANCAGRLRGPSGSGAFAPESTRVRLRGELILAG
jgi:hypothetical protein